jgi:hypothetical protein
VDYRQIHQKYRLSHVELQSTFKKLKEKLIEEIDDFSSKLVGTLNNLNYLRYMKAFPGDNIKFIFMEKGDGKSVEVKPE